MNKKDKSKRKASSSKASVSSVDSCTESDSSEPCAKSSVELEAKSRTKGKSSKSSTVPAGPVAVATPEADECDEFAEDYLS